MELVEVVVYVRDMERAIGFYRDTLRLELEFVFDARDPDGNRFSLESRR